MGRSSTCWLVRGHMWSTATHRLLESQPKRWGTSTGKVSEVPHVSCPRGRWRQGALQHEHQLETFRSRCRTKCKWGLPTRSSGCSRLWQFSARMTKQKLEVALKKAQTQAVVPPVSEQIEHTQKSIEHAKKWVVLADAHVQWARSATRSCWRQKNVLRDHAWRLRGPRPLFPTQQRRCRVHNSSTGASSTSPAWLHISDSGFCSETPTETRIFLFMHRGHRVDVGSADGHARGDRERQCGRGGQNVEFGGPTQFVPAQGGWIQGAMQRQSMGTGAVQWERQAQDHRNLCCGDEALSLFLPFGIWFPESNSLRCPQLWTATRSHLCPVKFVHSSSQRQHQGTLRSNSLGAALGLAGVSHDSPRTPNVHISGFRRLERDKKKREWGRKREKETAKFWGPTLPGPIFLGWAPPFGPHHDTHTQIQMDWPKMDWPKLDWPKSVPSQNTSEAPGPKCERKWACSATHDWFNTTFFLKKKRSIASRVDTLQVLNGCLPPFLMLFQPGRPRSRARQATPLRPHACSSAIMLNALCTPECCAPCLARELLLELATHCPWLLHPVIMQSADCDGGNVRRIWWHLGQRTG